MKTVLIIGYQPYAPLIDRPPYAPTRYCVIRHRFEEILAGGITNYIFHIVEMVQNGQLRIDGIAGTGDLSSIVASVIAGKLGLPGVRPDILALSYNKYYARMVQQREVPAYTPQFWDARELLAAPHASVLYPLFAKPMRANLSQGACVVRSRRELEDMVLDTQSARSFQEKLYADLVKSNDVFTPHKQTLMDNGILVEELLLGQQYTVDGYIYGGNVSLLGITESFFLPDSLSFSLFVTPAETTREFREHITNVCREVLWGLQLDNTVFNMEYRYDFLRDKLGIIEFHARPSMQFVPLIVWTTGVHPLNILSDLAVGTKPTMQRRKPRGAYGISRPLRRLSDALVTRVPTQHVITMLEKTYDALIFSRVEKGTKLSQHEQDMSSYCYAIINTYGTSLEDALGKSREIEKQLNYGFKPVS